jgi:actin related protein 2/3 complex subunit 1A/1B
MVKKKFKSTVLCCSFHPTNGQLLATGSSDFKCRIYSTFTSDVDNTVNPGPFSHTLGPLEFGEAYVELNALGWVHAVAWSPSGNVICYSCKSFSLFLRYLVINPFIFTFSSFPFLSS